MCPPTWGRAGRCGPCGRLERLHSEIILTVFRGSWHPNLAPCDLFFSLIPFVWFALFLCSICQPPFGWFGLLRSLTGGPHMSTSTVQFWPFSMCGCLLCIWSYPYHPAAAPALIPTPLSAAAPALSRSLKVRRFSLPLHFFQSLTILICGFWTNS